MLTHRMSKSARLLMLAAGFAAALTILPVREVRADAAGLAMLIGGTAIAGLLYHSAQPVTSVQTYYTPPQPPAHYSTGPAVVYGSVDPYQSIDPYYGADIEKAYYGSSQETTTVGYFYPATGPSIHNPQYSYSQGYFMPGYSMR
ncbi:MAG: hypothetical protein HQL56_13750 [Magnetococcales bacterium]|nr:hypothetical protein [Magnetococcales bacterium]